MLLYDRREDFLSLNLPGVAGFLSSLRFCTVLQFLEGTPVPHQADDDSSSRESPPLRLPRERALGGFFLKGFFTPRFAGHFENSCDRSPRPPSPPTTTRRHPFSLVRAAPFLVRHRVPENGQTPLPCGRLFFFFHCVLKGPSRAARPGWSSPSGLLHHLAQVCALPLTTRASPFLGGFLKPAALLMGGPPSKIVSWNSPPLLLFQAVPRRRFSSLLNLDQSVDWCATRLSLFPPDGKDARAGNPCWFFFCSFFPRRVLIVSVA